MRKVFIDCGYYRGKAIQIFKKMSEYDSSFEFFAFDANKFSDENKEKIASRGIEFINKAVWVYDGEITFYASGRRYGQANSVFPNPIKPRKEKARTVECIDFSKWIKENFSKDDHIVLKMDVEGAEYKIFNKMLDDGTMQFIDIMFAEYHYDRADATREDFQVLKERLRKETKVDIRKAIEW